MLFKHSLSVNKMLKGARLVVVAITLAVFTVLSTYLVYYYVNAVLTGHYRRKDQKAGG
jgi:hypothetical protein